MEGRQPGHAGLRMGVRDLNTALEKTVLHTHHPITSNTKSAIATCRFGGVFCLLVLFPLSSSHLLLSSSFPPLCPPSFARGPSLQCRLPMRGYESSRHLRELRHGLPHLVPGLHGRQLERHHEGTWVCRSATFFDERGWILLLSIKAKLWKLSSVAQN